ncbi:MAG: thiamine pyrophosphate-dependent enzyme [Candidatus Thermoplasmatota archaeon]|nr:thiamine pyrophosphate-dependent enzyme [Candidatus Thermoplasmatota archaeon]
MDRSDKIKLTLPKEEWLGHGNLGCQGCGGTLALRYTLKALGRRVIITIPACCWAVIGGFFPFTVFKAPSTQIAFEATGACCAGIEAGLKAKGIEDVTVLGWAGDGGTADIGIQALSGAVERNHNFLYICYDNEAYMNTGGQKSGCTPLGARTTTTPVGTRGYWKKSWKKNMPEIMAAHKMPYVATACISYPEDLIKKVKKASAIQGPKYIHILAPCPTAWGYSPEKTIAVGRLAVESCVFPLYEIENGIYKITKKPTKKIPVEEYLLSQGRFKHLPNELIEFIRKNVDKEWEELLKKEQQ